MIRFALTRDHEPRHIRRAARPLVAPAGLALCARATRRLRRGRISPLETARRHIGLKIGGIILDFSPIPCSCQSSPCDSEPFRPSVASDAPRHESRTPLLWEQLSRANRVRFCPSAFRAVSLRQFIAAFQPIRHASGKPVVSLSYSQSAAFAALASYSPSSGVQSSARTSVQRGARTHLGRDIVTS